VQVELCRVGSNLSLRGVTFMNLLIQLDDHLCDQILLVCAIRMLRWAEGFFPPIEALFDDLLMSIARLAMLLDGIDQGRHLAGV